MGSNLFFTAEAEMDNALCFIIDITKQWEIGILFPRQAPTTTLLFAKTVGNWDFASPASTHNDTALCGNGGKVGFYYASN